MPPARPHGLDPTPLGEESPGSREPDIHRADPGRTDPGAWSITPAAGSRTAEAVFAAYYPALAGYATSLVGDRELGQDMAAEAFVRVLGRLRGLKQVEDPKGYLYVTVTNLAKDHWRKRQRERRAFAKVGRTEEVAQPTGDPAVRDLVERLPDRLRKPVVLHYFADLSVAEISAVLHRPQGTVKRALYDARREMARQLGQEP